MERRASYDCAFKLKVVQQAIQMGSNRKAAKRFGINERQVREWRNKRNDLRKVRKTSKRLAGGGRRVKSSGLEANVVQWLTQQDGRLVTGKAIQQEARKLSTDQMFKASNGWLSKFKQRHGFKLRQWRKTNTNVLKMMTKTDDVVSPSESPPSDEMVSTGNACQETVTCTDVIKNNDHPATSVACNRLVAAPAGCDGVMIKERNRELAESRLNDTSVCNGVEPSSKENAINKSKMSTEVVLNGLDEAKVDDHHSCEKTSNFGLNEKVAGKVIEVTPSDQTSNQLLDDKQSSIVGGDQTVCDASRQPQSSSVTSESTVITIVHSASNTSKPSDVQIVPSSCPIQIPGDTKPIVVTWNTSKAHAKDNCHFATDVDLVSSTNSANMSDCFIVSSNLKKRAGEELGSLLTRPIKKEKVDPQYDQVQPVSKSQRKNVRPVVITPVASTPMPLLPSVSIRPRHSKSLTEVLLRSQPRPVHLIPNTTNKTVRNVAANNVIINRASTSYTPRLRAIRKNNDANNVVLLKNVSVPQNANLMQKVTIRASNGVVNNNATKPTVLQCRMNDIELNKVGNKKKVLDLTRHDVMRQLLEFPAEVTAYEAPTLPEHLQEASCPQKQHFKCESCRSTFSSNDSLVAHTTRRSASIRWFPPQGGAYRQFYNRCMLLAEVGRDALSGSITVLSPLDVDDMLHHECGECGHKTSSVASLQQHLDDGQGADCVHCGMHLSGCRAKAHARFHTTSTPHVCPECGLHILNKEYFLKHVSRQCHHVDRKMRYACVTCPRVFTSVSAARTHVLSDHAPAYHKCHECPMAFRSKHAFKKHADCHTPPASATELHKCPLCDTVFKQTGQLNAHVTTAHVAACMRRAVFLCGVCKLKHHHHDAHVAHMASKHPLEHDSCSSGCNVCGVAVSDKTVSDKVTVTPERSPQYTGDLPRCDHCNVTFTDDAAHTRHMRKHRFMASRRTAVPSTTEVVCKVCEQKFTGDVELAEHERTEHGTQKSHACHLCAQTYADDEQLAAHHKMVHCAQQVAQSPTEMLAFSCPVCAVEGLRRSFKRRTQLAKHLAAVHRYDSPAALELPVSVEETPQVSEAPAPLKTLRVYRQGSFVCAKCDFHETDHTVFKSHITKHRSRECAAQCPECGLCFAVTPALKRHLMVVHRIHKLAEYQQETGVELSPPPSPPPPKYTPLPPPDNPLQCGVCSMVFDNAASVRTHMRTHGMAFIRSSLTSTVPASETVTID